MTREQKQAFGYGFGRFALQYKLWKFIFLFSLIIGLAARS
jgi:hypothetical protein